MQWQTGTFYGTEKEIEERERDLASGTEVHLQYSGVSIQTIMSSFGHSM